jgi:hypothetical protein
VQSRNRKKTRKMCREEASGQQGQMPSVAWKGQGRRGAEYYYIEGSVNGDSIMFDIQV